MLKKEQYVKTVKRPYPPLLASLVLSGCAEEEHFKPFLSTPFAFKDIVISDADWYYSKETTEKSRKVTFEHWLNYSNFQEAIKLFKEKEKNLLEAVNLDFKSFCRAFEAYMPALILVWQTDQPVADKVRELLHSNLPTKEAEELINILNTPLEDNYYKKEEYDLVHATDLKKHVKEYEWINSRYGEEHPYTFEEAKEKLSKINKSDFLKKWKEDKENLKSKIEYAKKILGKDAHIIDFMQFIIYYRTQRTDTMYKAIYNYIPKLKDIAKSKGLTYKQLLYCTKEEVDSNIPSNHEIESRMEDYAMILESGRTYCVSGKEADKVRKILEEEIKQVKEFTGTVACKGFVKGKVKIIMKGTDYTKINQGDILVTSMTTPNMIAIMKKSVAFVTDEGGITCHAAIISREMKKPCIIGTRIATKILKDGQEIQVDANKGVVKIL